jgi:aldose 1-epimerase
VSVSADTTELAERAPFGVLDDGRQVERFVLRNSLGMAVAVLSYGGIIQSVEVPDRSGRIANVTLGFADLAGYTDPAYVTSPPFFGALIGRYANRIARGRFLLDGAEYRLAINDVPNHLHGGGPPDGFDVRLWEIEPEPGGLRLSLVSPAGEAGYPGALRVAVTYALAADANVLAISYEAVADAPTIVNLTSHAYWNLAGFGTVYDHELQVLASRYTPVDDTAIPVPGPPVEVAGTRFDRRRPRSLAAGIDHNFVLDAPGAAAVLSDPASGRVLTVETDQPGLQVYTADALDGSLTGPDGRPYVRGAGVALETQHFPDSPNRPDFPSTVLRPGETYRFATSFRFTTTAAGGADAQ